MKGNTYTHMLVKGCCPGTFKKTATAVAKYLFVLEFGYCTLCCEVMGDVFTKIL